MCISGSDPARKCLQIGLRQYIKILTARTRIMSSVYGYIVNIVFSVGPYPFRGYISKAVTSYE
jgi:hypothetical protein